MATDLSPTEKEEREVERLIDKKPAPSRKPAERRGPKHDNRRDRMTVDDPDMAKSDKDMSLNYKSSSSLSDVALRVYLAAGGKKPADPGKTQKSPAPDPGKTQKSPGKTQKSPGQPAPSKPKKPSAPSKDPAAPLRKAVDGFTKSLRDLAPAVAKDFEKYAQGHYISPLSSMNGDAAAKEADEKIRHVRQLQDDLKDRQKEYAGKFKSMDLGELTDAVVANWPNGRPDHWPTRAGIIAGLESAMDRLSLPGSFKAPFLNPGKDNPDLQQKLVLKMISDAESGKVKRIPPDEITAFAEMASLYKAVSANPDSLDAGTLRAETKRLGEVAHKQASDLAAAMQFLAEWESMANEYTEAKKKGAGAGFKPSDNYNSALRSLDSFFGSKDPVVDPDVYASELKKRAKAVLSGSPEALKAFEKGFSRFASFRGAASNDAGWNETMVQKSASYHGTVQQGHPDGPSNTPYRSYDKRYFGKEHYESILKAASSLMDEDWMKYGWEGGSADAQCRAALDLAIHMADSSLYQSKIDAETYDMLLNRLAGWGHDSFSETVMPDQGAKRSASAMKPAYRNIVRIANDLRERDPRRSLEIMKNLRALVAQEQEQQGAPMAAPVAQSGDDSKKPDVDELKSKSKKLVDAKDMDDFLAGLKELGDVMKHASSRVAADLKPGDTIDFKSLAHETEMPELAALEDMSDEEVAAFIKDQKSRAQELTKAPDLDSFLAGFDEMMKSVDEAAKKVKTGSVLVQISTLVRVAAASPEAAALLRPALLAAKKKMMKKKPAKTSQKDGKSKGTKEKDGKMDDKSKGPKEPFGGKKAPPFGKKAPPFGKKKDTKTSKKRKAAIEASDADW